MEHINLTALAQSAFQILNIEECNIDDVREAVVLVCSDLDNHIVETVIDLVIQMIEASEE